jgi:hypothetical protein
MRVEWFHEGQALSARNRNGKGLKAFHNKPLARAEELVWFNREQIVSELLVLVYAKIQLAVHGCALCQAPLRLSSPAISTRGDSGNNGLLILMDLQLSIMNGFAATKQIKRESESDIDTVVVDSLKARDPNRPIREADIGTQSGNVGFVRILLQKSFLLVDQKIFGL